MPLSESQGQKRLGDGVALSSMIGGLVVVAIGVLVLFGWAIGNETLTRIRPGLATMKPNTALALLLCGFALWCAHDKRRALRRHAGLVAALLATVLGGLTLLEYMLDTSFGIDQLLFHVTTGQHPGRMAQMTASLITCLGFALLILDVETRSGFRPAQGLALVVIAAATIAALGYLFRVEALYAVRPYSTVAMHTALSLEVLALGLLAARPYAGVMRRITADSVSGQVGRRLIPLVVLVPIAVAWLRIEGQHLGWYDTEFGTALHATASVMLLVALTWWAVGALWRRERARDQFEAELANSEEDLAITVNSIGDAVIATDLAGRVTRMNPVAESLTGWSLSEARGRPLEEVFRIIDEASRDVMTESPVKRVLREGHTAGRAENPVLVGRNGTERPIAESAAPMRSEDGEVRGVVLVFRDLSDERKEQSARLLVELQLHHAQARNSAILESAVDGIIAMDSHGFIIEFNPSAERIFRMTREQALGRTVAEMVVPERMRDAHSSAVARHLATGEQRVLGRTVQLPAMRGDGTEFPAEIVLSRVEGIDPPVFTAFVRDVTDRKRAEAEREQLTSTLQRRVVEVEAANRELDSFAYVASHDLRSPLRDILSLSAWIAEDSEGLMAAGSLKHLATLQSRAARMERLLDDLLEYSRIGRTAPKTEDVRVSDIVDDALELVGSREGFAIETTGGDALLHTPRTPLVHALRNLVNNAIKHHDKRHGRIRIDVVPDRPGLLQFAVADDGPGIAPEYHDVVFQPFRTLRRRDEVEGSGLGLAIVKKMVESVGGSVAISSRPGAGTCISFTWPERWEPRQEEQR